MRPRHLFLTGEPGAGKTTLLARALALRPGLRAGGFRTFTRLGDTEALRARVYLAAWDDRAAWRWDGLGAPPPGVMLAGVRPYPGGCAQAAGHAEAFDRAGAALLDPDGADVIVMDELGFLERDARAFQAAVLRALDGDAPVLGAIKPRREPFLDAVRAHPAVAVAQVRPDAREQALQAVLELMDAYL